LVRIYNHGTTFVICRLWTQNRHISRATRKYNESIEPGEKLASVCFKSRDTIHERLFVAHRSHAYVRHAYQLLSNNGGNFMFKDENVRGRRIFILVESRHDHDCPCSVEEIIDQQINRCSISVKAIQFYY
jgi:hypothetical protein